MRTFAAQTEPAVPEAVTIEAAPPPQPEGRPARLRSRAAIGTTALALVLSLFWLGVWGAFLWGYLGPQGLTHLPLQTAAMLTAAVALPPLLFFTIALLLARSFALGQTAEVLLAASDRLFAVDDVAAKSAARLGRSVRRELDGLNTGLDGAYQRLRALETVLENQIAALDQAGARAEVRGESIAARLGQESERLELVSGQLTDAASRAGETVAGRAAQIKSGIEAAEGSLKMAAQSLDVQAAGFRAAASLAAESPHAAAVELDAQAKRITEVSDTMLARAEFVLARQEKQRATMSDMLAVLKAESDTLETALERQRAGMENAVAQVRSEAGKFEDVTGDAQRHIEMLMANAAQRASQLTGVFAREADRLKETGEASQAVLVNLVSALREAGLGAQTLIGESAAQARGDAQALVGEAMGECERLLRVAGELSAEASKIRTTLAKSTEDLERHLIRLPGIAQDEARRVRLIVREETEQLLDLSARTLSAAHARSNQKSVPTSASPVAREMPVVEDEGLKGLARKLTQRRPRKDEDGGKAWEMKTLLAAVEGPGEDRTVRISNAAALGALEMVLADMAIDLSALDDAEPGEEEWKRYAAGDRAIFARRLAALIDDQAVDRITALYRDDERFHAAADAYLGEFVALLERAREGDGGGLLTSTLLSADTGKVYLALAYALGRL